MFVKDVIVALRAPTSGAFGDEFLIGDEEDDDDDEEEELELVSAIILIVLEENWHLLGRVWEGGVPKNSSEAPHVLLQLHSFHKHTHSCFIYE
jgi:hypothetical protein